MEYNSDYEVRLATLGALGGDTTKKYDSVYSIDLAILEAIEQGGGGGGLNYNQIKELLASSGLTEIVFNDGASSITLDYDLVAQIGQGGAGESNYYIRDTYDELSGITGAKNGAIAYVKEHQGTDEVMVLTVDLYNSDWYYLNLNYGDYDHTFYLGSNNSQIYSEYRWYNADGDDCGDWFNFNDHSADIPVKTTMSNGAVLQVQSFEEGEEYAEHNELKVTYYVYKHNGNFPSVNISGYDGAIVATGTSTETVAITIPALGWFQYDDAVTGTNKWVEKLIYIENFSSADLGRMANNFIVCHQPISAIRRTEEVPNTIYDIIGWYSDGNSMLFASKPIQTPSVVGRFYQFNVNYDNDSSQWKLNEVGRCSFTLSYELENERKNINRRLGGRYEESFQGAKDGGLYNFVPSGSATFEIWSYQVTKESSEQNFDWLCQFRDKRSYREQKVLTNFYDLVKTIDNGDGLYFEPAVNADWQFVGYEYNQEADAYGICAFKIVDNGSTFTIYVAISKEGSAVSQENRFEISFNSTYQSNWTQESDEVIAYQPHLYQIYAYHKVPDGDLRLKRRTLI